MNADNNLLHMIEDGIEGGRRLGVRSAQQQMLALIGELVPTTTTNAELDLLTALSTAVRGLR